MTTQYFIVEGDFITFLLERILPDDILIQSKIITGNNYQIALSKARAILISGPDDRKTSSGYPDATASNCCTPDTWS